MAGAELHVQPEPIDQQGLERAHEVARRWLPAFAAGRRADEELYAPGASTWHNIGEWEAPILRTPSRARRIEGGADLRLAEIRCRVFSGGFVVQAVTVGTSATGEPVRVPTCLVVTLVDGLISRFEEYADSAAAAALFPETAKTEHSSH